MSFIRRKDNSSKRKSKLSQTSTPASIKSNSSVINSVKSIPKLETPQIRSIRSRKNSSSIHSVDSFVSNHDDVKQSTQSLQIEKHMATPESTISNAGILSTLVNAAHHAAASLVSSQKPNNEDLISHPQAQNNQSFLQHLDSLLTHDSTNVSIRKKASPELDDTESLYSVPKSIIGEVVFQPLRNKPIATIGKGELTLKDLGFAESNSPVRNLSVKTNRSEFPKIEIIQSTPIESKELVFESSNQLPAKADGKTSRLRPAENNDINSDSINSRVNRSMNRSVSPSNSHLIRASSPINFLKGNSYSNRRNTLTSTLSNNELQIRPDLELTRTFQSVLSDTNFEGINIPSTKRQTEFHNLFPLIPQHEILLEDFSCALQKDILVRGKMYLSQRHISFNSNILGWTTNITIPLKEVVQIEKKTIAGLFPNAIAIRSLHQRYVFASLIQRDSTFTAILSVWKQVVKSERGDNIEGFKRDSSYELFDDETENNSDYDSVVSDFGSEDSQSEVLDDEINADDDDDSGAFDVNKPDDDRPVPVESDFLGPQKHKQTEFDHTSIAGETKILERLIDAPIGKVFKLLFGNDSKFLKKSLESQKNYSISDIPSFNKFSENESRSYTYTKPLNSPVGPKETLCQVEEIFHRIDFNNFVEVQQKVKTPDVPSGNSFIVNTWFYLSWDVKNQTKVTIFTNVEWIGKSWIKAAVEKGTIVGQKDSLNKLVDDLIVELSFSSSPPVEAEESVSILPIIGPKVHSPTSAPIKLKSSETQVFDDIINAPLGTTFLILFNDSDTSFYQSVIAKQKNYNISNIPGFTNKSRSYEYTKPINAPIGPKETKCLVTETIENMDLNSYILINQSTQTPDVPSGNSFVTVTSIYLSWGENNSTRMIVTTEVQWKGRSWIKSAVEKGSIEGQKESMSILFNELKDYISKNSGTKRSRRGTTRKRLSTRSTIPKQAVETNNDNQNGISSQIMAILDPALSIIGIDASDLSIYKIFTWLVLIWFILSFSFNLLFGSHKAKNSNIQLNDINKIIISGEEYLILPKIPQLLSDVDTKAEAEYDIWEWIEKRKNTNLNKSGKFAINHNQQDLKYMIDLAEQYLDSLKEVIED